MIKKVPKISKVKNMQKVPKTQKDQTLKKCKKVTNSNKIFKNMKKRQSKCKNYIKSITTNIRLPIISYCFNSISRFHNFMKF